MSIRIHTTYYLIQQHYGDRTAERSGVPLMHHIDEGIAILEALGASRTTQQAWCLHPLIQGDADLIKFYEKHIVDHLNARVILLAMEYRNQANAWLSDKVKDDSPYSYSDDTPRRVGPFIPCLIGAPTPGPLLGVKQMLIADKVQNYKDFLVHHKGTHPRSAELEVYFKTWLGALDIDDAEFERLCEIARSAKHTD